MPPQQKPASDNASDDLYGGARRRFAAFGERGHQRTSLREPRSWTTYAITAVTTPITIATVAA